MAFGFGFALTAIAKAVGFSPLNLFASGAQGAWYDPSDYTTLFEDAAGTIPITSPLEKPVGLMLDKSQGLVLGPELVTNGDFSNGTTGWTAFNAVISISNGALKVDDSANAGSNSSAIQKLTITSGKFYKITFDIVSTDANGWAVSLCPNATTESSPQVLAIGTTTGNKTIYFVASTNQYLYLVAASTGITYFDNISVRELPGNHATQSTTTSRPTLSARYNLLTKTEQFDDAAWLKTGVSLTNQGNGVWRLQAPASSWSMYQAVTVNNATSNLSIEVKSNGAGLDNFRLILSGNQATDYTATSSWQRVTRQGIHNNGTACGIWAAAAGTAIDILIRFPDLRVANDGVNLPSYQRVNTSTDFAVDGFPAAEVFDGTDDNQITAAGGGSTTAFFWCSSIRVGKVGAVQTLFSDTGTNTGYRVRINASNRLELAAGNGSAYTTATTSDTLALGQRAVLTAWHDGANLNVQINNGTVVQTAFATATAGTAQITIGKDNNAASSFFMGRLYEKVYLKDTVLSAANIAATKSFCAQKAKVTL